LPAFSMLGFAVLAASRSRLLFCLYVHHDTRDMALRCLREVICRDHRCDFVSIASGDELLVNDQPVPKSGDEQMACSRYLQDIPMLACCCPNDDAWRSYRRLRPRASSPATSPRVSKLRPESCVAEYFKADTVRWYLANSEDANDIAAMLGLATASVHPGLGLGREIQWNRRATGLAPVRLGDSGLVPRLSCSLRRSSSSRSHAG